MSDAALAVEELYVEYASGGGAVAAVQDVSFEIESGEILGIVGESGCGKSTLALSLLGLLPRNARIRSGSIRLGTNELVGLDDAEMRSLRGREISVVFQDPMNSLNPTLTVGKQLADIVRAHSTRSERGSRQALRQRVVAALDSVGIPDPQARINDYPHQFSGGMRQRILIAMSLLLGPSVIVADEPTSALDVTLASQILQLLEDLRSRFGTSILLVTHDLGIVAEVCDRAVIMYAGEIVERGPVDDLFQAPLHPYTEALLQANLSGKDQSLELPTIPGRVPPLSALPTGCNFQDRCAYAQSVCTLENPEEIRIGVRSARCYIHDPAADFTRDAGGQSDE